LTIANINDDFAIFKIELDKTKRKIFFHNITAPARVVLHGGAG
jgi:hypothetical protein